MAPKIAASASANLKWLEAEGWTSLLPELQKLHRRSSRQLERQLARRLAAGLTGIGPKQSRNMLQYLGLTRHEVPLDSRLTKWLNEFGFPVPLSALLLSDEDYYCFVGDAFHAICDAANIAPCLLDAAIFSSFDGDGWATEGWVQGA